MSVFELIMMVMFGMAWPLNIIHQVRTKTARGKSPWFYIVILVAYASAIVNKLVYGVDAVLYASIANFCMVLTGLILMLHYRRLDKLKEAEGSAK